jgi:hypothetical protein
LVSIHPRAFECGSEALGRAGRFFPPTTDAAAASWPAVLGAVRIVLVREAGGFVTDRGSDRAIERNELLAGNAQLHSRLQKLVVRALLQLRRVRWQG